MQYRHATAPARSRMRRPCTKALLKEDESLFEGPNCPGAASIPVEPANPSNTSSKNIAEGALGSPSEEERDLTEEDGRDDTVFSTCNLLRAENGTSSIKESGLGQVTSRVEIFGQQQPVAKHAYPEAWWKGTRQLHQPDGRELWLEYTEAGSTAEMRDTTPPYY